MMPASSLWRSRTSWICAYRSRRGKDAIGEVGAIEVADEELGVVERELRGDVAADGFGRGGGEGVDGRVGEHLLQVGELAVLGAEVVAPGADAVGFVDGEGLDAGIAEHGVERLAAADQAFRRKVKQVQVSGAEVCGDHAASSAESEESSCAAEMPRERSEST